MHMFGHFKNFKNNQKGQFAMMMAILSLPLMAGVGLAIDYSYAVQTRTRLRAANDSAALFAASYYKKQGALPNETAVHAFLNTNFDHASGELDPAVKLMKIDHMVLTLDSKVDAPVFIMGIFGQHKTEINVTSSVTVGQDTALEIALALDTTNSMLAFSGNSSDELDPDRTYFTSPKADVTRIEALKFSASRFTTTIFGTADLASRSRIAIVPFAQYVNVGTKYRGESWLSVPDDQASTGQSCYDYTPVLSTSNCHEVMVNIDGAMVPTTQCDNVYGPVEHVCYPTGGSAWYGCVGSRQQPLNLRDASPSSKFTGLPNIWCGSPLQTLSADKDEILSTINGLSPYGSTYIPEGVMWATRTLSSLVPFTSVKQATPDVKLKKILVLMTDGENTNVADLPDAPTHHEIYQGNPSYSADQQQPNNWTLAACKQAKDSEIELFTISFGHDIGVAAKGVIKDCATDDTHYYDAGDAKKLSDAFASIAYRVSATYLSN